MKRIIMAGLVTVLAGIGSAAWAEPGQERGDGPGPMPGPAGPGKEHAMGARMLQRLADNPEKAKEFGITPQQATELKASFHEMEKKMIALRSQAELAQLEVRKLMDADEPDEAALMAAIDQAGAAHTAIQKATAEQRLAVRKIVGPETMKKIKDMVGDRLRQARGGEGGEGGEPMMKRSPRGEEEGKGRVKGGGKDAPWKKGQMEPPSDE